MRRGAPSFSDENAGIFGGGIFLYVQISFNARNSTFGIRLVYISLTRSKLFIARYIHHPAVILTEASYGRLVENCSGISASTVFSTGSGGLFALAVE